MGTHFWIENLGGIKTKGPVGECIISFKPRPMCQTFQPTQLCFKSGFFQQRENFTTLKNRFPCNFPQSTFKCISIYMVVLWVRLQQNHKLGSVLLVSDPTSCAKLFYQHSFVLSEDFFNSEKILRLRKIHFLVSSPKVPSYVYVPSYGDTSILLLVRLLKYSQHFLGIQFLIGRPDQFPKHQQS